MDPLNSRSLMLGCAAVIVLTQQLEGIDSAVSDVQDTADSIQGRTGALTESISSVARACSFR